MSFYEIPTQFLNNLHIEEVDIFHQSQQEINTHTTDKSSTSMTAMTRWASTLVSLYIVSKRPSAEVRKKG